LKGGVMAGLYFTLNPSTVHQSSFIYRSLMANDHSNKRGGIISFPF
jgi:hypothetical protein